mmetsp:Transcript_109088/g.260294  ORF Transcript_109088/g.260294 Transcript_109088/m.260294 type:complete len:348 (+) Transcript_109088:2-1045(+)
MQAEPYMTHSQMEWLSELTDKDGEGRLLPMTLLPRLGVMTAMRAEPLSRNNVPPRPSLCRPVAHSLPQVLVLAALLWRVRQRLFLAGSQITLGSLLGLFDIADGSNRQQAAASMLSRDLLASLLGHLRLSISVAEADELLAALAASSGGGKRSGDSGCVQVALLYDIVDRAGQPEMETMVVDLREAARQRLWGKGSYFSSVAGSATEWVSEADFRRALKAAMAEYWSLPGAMPDDEEDRLVLLADKDAEGRVLWRSFVQAFCGGIDLDVLSEATEEVPPSPGKAIPRKAPGPLQSPTCVGVGGTQQSWRSAKAAQKDGRSVVSSKGQSDPPLSPQNKQGFCCCRRRS